MVGHDVTDERGRFEIAGLAGLAGILAALASDDDALPLTPPRATPSSPLKP